MSNLNEDFQKELESIINKYSIDNELNTQDFVLSSFLMGCLAGYKHMRLNPVTLAGNSLKINSV